MMSEFHNNNYNNRCIVDNRKGAARRSQNCIRKTKKHVLWKAGIFSDY